MARQMGATNVQGIEVKEIVSTYKKYSKKYKKASDDSLISKVAAATDRSEVTVRRSLHRVYSPARVYEEFGATL